MYQLHNLGLKIGKRSGTMVTTGNLNQLDFQRFQKQLYLIHSFLTQVTKKNLLKKVEKSKWRKKRRMERKKKNAFSAKLEVLIYGILSKTFARSNSSSSTGRVGKNSLLTKTFFSVLAFLNFLITNMDNQTKNLNQAIDSCKSTIEKTVDYYLLQVMQT